MEQQQDVLLKNYTDMEKGAYLGAIASIATADHTASPEEIEYLMELADTAGLSEEQKQVVAKAATELTGEELKRCLDILKNSELRFSLMTDLISFAKADEHYSEQEQANIEKMAQHLNINHEQFSLLNEFTDKTTHAAAVDPGTVQQQGFLSSLGLDGLNEKFSKSGINIGSLAKGLLGIAGPMILANMMRRGMGGRSGGRGFSPFGQSGMGGMGGLGNLGGFGSLIGMLNGGRGYSGTGGLLGKIFGR